MAYIYIYILYGIVTKVPNSFGFVDIYTYMALHFISIILIPVQYIPESSVNLVYSGAIFGV